MSTPHSIRGPRTNEELFFDYYSQLLEWAAQLTQQDRADAEDLVQDLYVQIAHIGVPLAEVDDLRPYLFKVLRNLHYSRLRQKGRIPISDLSALDYDSVERGLGAVDWRDLFLVRSDLKRICEFACQRRHTARSASIFLLRFFLGYYPSEVMKVAQTTRVGLDKALQLMRRETQIHLDKASTQVSSSHSAGVSSPVHAPDHSRALFLELRQMIFNAREGRCFDAGALKRHFEEQSAKQLSVKELAHLVSCKICLDRVNTLLGFPLLDERSPDDTIGRQNPPSASGSEGPHIAVRRPAKKPDAQVRRALGRAQQDRFEHRPVCLEVCVNGETRTSQRITAAISEFHLKLNRTEAAEFIEIFSEQQVRLLYLHVLEPILCPGLEQRQVVELSDGRSLSLTFSYASDLPTVHVLYRDPVFAELTASNAEDLSDTETEPTFQAIDGEQPDDTALSSSVVSFSARSGLFSSLYPKRTWSWLPRMNPLFASALVLACGSIICFMLWLHSGPGIGAAAFLERAQAQDASAKVSESPGVIFQKIRIKTPRRATVRTLYRDAQRKRRVKPRELDAEDSRLEASLTSAGLDWNDPLSAAGFGNWRSREAIENDSVKRSGPDLLTLTTKVSNDNSVISESLTVRESDFHTVEKTIELRNYGTVEIAELNYDVLPWGAINQDWFEPLAAMPGKVSSDVHPALLPHLPVRLTDLQLDEAELEARLALNRLHADTSERLQIVRDPRGIFVRGIVETVARKEEIKKQLFTIAHVTPVVLTFEESARQPLASAETSTITQSSVVAEPSPLERYLTAKGESQADVSATYREFFSTSVAINQSSRSLADLMQRFASGEQLTPAARSALEQLVRQDEKNIDAALVQQESLIRNLVVAKKDGAPAAPLAFSVSDLKIAATRNVSLTNELITGGSDQPRSAEVIAVELSTSIIQMENIVSHLPYQPLQETPSFGSSIPSLQR